MLDLEAITQGQPLGQPGWERVDTVQRRCKFPRIQPGTQKHFSHNVSSRLEPKVGGQNFSDITCSRPPETFIESSATVSKSVKKINPRTRKTDSIQNHQPVERSSSGHHYEERKGFEHLYLAMGCHGQKWGRAKKVTLQ